MLVKTDQYILSELQNVLIVRWLKAPTGDALARSEESLSLEKLTGWLIIAGVEGPSESTFSKYAAAQVQRMAAHGLRAVAAVHSDQSIGGKLARVAMQVINVFSQGQAETRLFASTRDACVWLTRKVPSPTVEELEREILRLSQ